MKPNRSNPSKGTAPTSASPRTGSAWRAATAGALAWSLLLAGVANAAGPPGSAGESLYLRGILGSGAPLEGTRVGGSTSVTGAAAACVNCHQRSGLGSKEGALTIPPITGDYLFHTHEHGAGDAVLPYVTGMHGNRDPYTDASVARAIRQGLDSQGRPLGYLMPRYALDDSEMTALLDYLRKLDSRRVAGVTDTMLHFATILTPDSDANKRRGVVDVLEHYVTEKNLIPFPPSPRMQTSGKTEFAKSMYMANRHWQLHVWQLTGPPAGWRAQLEEHLRQEPVYAVLSGVGGSNWAPVHEFCEQNSVPCLFPNVEVPVVADHDFYSLYFSKGVLLEADLVAASLERTGEGLAGGTLVQVYRQGDSGEKAAEALAARLAPRGIKLRRVALPPNADRRALAKAVAAASDAAVLVLWLRPPDVAALGAAPGPRVRVYMSGLLGGLETSPLPADWRARTRLTYPFDLPDKRGVRLDYPLGWFRIRQIPVVAIQAQADTYLACSVVADAFTHHMADVTSRAYLVEQIQSMLETRIITGYYPRLTLAANQRFASKGGYVAHFADTQGQRLVADSDWTVP